MKIFGLQIITHRRYQELLADIDYKQGLLDRLRMDNADLAERARNFQYNYENTITQYKTLQRSLNHITNKNNRLRKKLPKKP